MLCQRYGTSLSREGGRDVSARRNEGIATCVGEGWTSILGGRKQKEIESLSCRKNPRKSHTPSLGAGRDDNGGGTISSPIRGRGPADKFSEGIKRSLRPQEIQSLLAKKKKKPGDDIVGGESN